MSRTLDGARVGEISFVIGARDKQTCVIARETDAPAGVESIAWCLLPKSNRDHR